MLNKKKWIVLDNALLSNIKFWRSKFQIIFSIRLKLNKHEIEIEYHSPLKAEGAVISLIGISLLLSIAICESITDLKKKIFQK